MELSDTDGVVLLRNDYIVGGARGDGFEDIPFLNQTDTWLDSSGLSVPEGIVAIEVLDIEADGAPDVLLGSYRSTANSRVLRHTGDFDAPLLTVSTFSPGDRVYGLSLGDLNRDGVMDVMIPNLGYKRDSEGEAACNDGTGDTSRCWPQIGIGVGAEFDTSLTDQVTPFWFDAATAAAAADDPTIHELAVTAVFGALDAEVVDFNGDGVLDIYLVTGETRQLNFGGGHHPRSDWDRIYLSTSMCEVAQ